MSATLRSLTLRAIEPPGSVLRVWSCRSETDLREHERQAATSSRESRRPAYLTHPSPTRVMTP